MASTSKTTTISGTNINGNTVELEIPNTSMKTTLSNNITSFNRPKTDPQNTPNEPRETRALNMNQIRVENQVTAKISDEAADKLHNGNGDKPNLSNKEDWIQELFKLYVAGSLIDLKSTNSDTYGDTSEFRGYLHNMDYQEKSRNASSIYDVTIKHVDEVAMNS